MHLIHKESNYTGKVYQLKRKLGPFPQGVQVYCFAHVGDKVWLELPAEWAGVKQVNLNVEVFKSVI